MWPHLIVIVVLVLGYNKPSMWPHLIVIVVLVLGYNNLSGAISHHKKQDISPIYHQFHWKPIIDPYTNAENHDIEVVDPCQCSNSWVIFNLTRTAKYCHSPRIHESQNGTDQTHHKFRQRTLILMQSHNINHWNQRIASTRSRWLHWTSNCAQRRCKDSSFSLLFGHIRVNKLGQPDQINLALILENSQLQ